MDYQKFKLKSAQAIKQDAVQNTRLHEDGSAGQVLVLQTHEDWRSDSQYPHKRWADVGPPTYSSSPQKEMERGESLSRTGWLDKPIWKALGSRETLLEYLRLEAIKEETPGQHLKFTWTHMCVLKLVCVSRHNTHAHTHTNTHLKNLIICTTA